MHFRRSRVALIIGLVGLLLCAGNLWFTAQRSAIPRSFDNVLARKEIGREKHPGKDDVHWLVLENGPTLHVDESVFNAVNVGERLQKESWSRDLLHGGNVHRLDWSNDFRGMVWVMAIGVIAVALLGVGRRRV